METHGFGGRKIILVTIALFLTFSLISFGVFAVPTNPSASCWKTKTCPIDPDQPADKTSVQKPVPQLHSAGSPTLPIDGSKGIQKVLVIPVTFSDISPTKTIAEANASLQKLVDYYKEVSYGKLELEVVFASTDWVELSETMAWYGEDTEDEIDPYTGLLFVDAIAAVDADVDFNGFDHILVLHADRDQAADSDCTDCIWSSRIKFGTPIVTDDGATINGALTVAEIKSYDEPEFSLGTAAHELAHDIISPVTGRGAYDLYNILTGASVVGKWSLMDSGAWLNPPAHLDPLHKSLYEWTADAEMQVPVGESRIVTLKPSADNPNFLTVIGSKTELFFVENRIAKGFDTKVPEEGVVIWHFDLVNLFLGNLFNALDPPGLAVESLSTINNAAFVDGEAFKTPLSDLNDGTTTGIVIDQIKRTGEEFSFRINNNDTTPPDLKVVLPSPVEATKDVSIVLDSPDAVSCTYSREGLVNPLELEWDGKNWKGMDTPGDGKFVYSFECKDAADNTASKELDVLVDSTPPTINVLLPEPVTTSKDIIINIKTDLDVVSCTYSRPGVDAVNLEELGGIWKGTDSLEEGKTELSFKCTDNAGNSASTTFTVTIDKTPPSITVLSPAATVDKDTILKTADVSVEIKADDDATYCSYSRTGLEKAVELIKEGEVWKASDTLSEGLTSFVFACNDNAGNIAITPQFHMVLVDLSPPTLKTKYIEDGTVFAGFDPQLLKPFEITVDDACLDPKSTGLKVDGIDLTSLETGVGIAFPGPPIEGLQCTSGISFLYRLNLSEYSEGSHTLEFRAADILGRETVKTFNVEFAQRSPVATIELAEGQKDRIEFGELFSIAADFKIDDMLVYPTAKTVGSLFKSLNVRLIPRVGLFGSEPVLCTEYNEPDTADISETIDCFATGIGGPQLIVVEGYDTYSNFISQGFIGPTVYNAEPSVFGSAKIENKNYALKEGDFVFDAISGDYSTGIFHASDGLSGTGAKIWTLNFTVSAIDYNAPAPPEGGGGGSGGSGPGPQMITVYITNPGAVPVLDGNADGFTGRFKLLWDGKEISSDEKGVVNVTWTGTGCKNNTLCSIDEMNENLREEMESGNKALPPWTIIIETELTEGSVIPVTVMYETPTIHIERTVIKNNAKVSYLLNATAPNQFYSEDNQYIVFPIIQNITYNLPNGSERVEELSGNYSLLDSVGEEVSGSPFSFCKTLTRDREYKVCYGGIKHLLSGDSIGLNFTADLFFPKLLAELETKASGGAGANVYKKTVFISVASDYTIENEMLPGFSGASDKKVFVDGKELSAEEWKEGSVIILGIEPGPHEVEVKYTVPSPQVSNPAPSSGGGGGGGGSSIPSYSLTAKASENNLVLNGQETKTIEIEFENKGYEKLTGFSFVVEGLPAEWFRAESLPKEIGAGEKVKVSIVFAPRGPSSELAGKIVVKSVEGAVAETEVKVSYTGSAKSPAPQETTTTTPTEELPIPVPPQSPGPTGLFVLDTGTALGVGIGIVVLAVAAYSLRGSKSWAKIAFRHKYGPRRFGASLKRKF
ncbi:MAG: immune inhibitor A [Candidatus Aenigmarchaeota archaeon]|nr:immune inhibitor A [Candidatus Aenigmarchaeota archaeon]